MDIEAACRFSFRTKDDIYIDSDKNFLVIAFIFYQYKRSVGRLRSSFRVKIEMLKSVSVVLLLMSLLLSSMEAGSKRDNINTRFTLFDSEGSCTNSTRINSFMYILFRSFRSISLYL